MHIDIPGTKKVWQNSFCCLLISVNITPPWMGKTAELGKLPSIESYSGRHFGFQSQKGGRRGFQGEDSLLHSPFLLLGHQKASAKVYCDSYFLDYGSWWWQFNKMSDKTMISFVFYLFYFPREAVKGISHTRQWKGQGWSSVSISSSWLQ